MPALARRAGWLPLLLGIPLLLALGVAASEYRALRTAGDLQPFEHLDRLAATQPWGGLSAREAARELEVRWRLDPAAAASALDWQLTRYPLDAWRWLLSARIQRELHLLQTAVPEDPAPRHALDIGAAQAVHPRNRSMQWEAINLAQTFGDAGLVAEQLRLWLHGQPAAVDRALFLARRWLPDPGQRLDRVLPAGEDYLVSAMRHARATGQLDLASAVWARLPQPRAADDRALADYVHITLAANRTDVTMALWRDLDPAYRPGALPGGHFGVGLAALDALGWNFRLPAGARVRLDEALPEHVAATPTGRIEPRSLRVDFNGNENINLNAPRLRFPVPEPGAYRLRGWWQAEYLTTRSLPALVVQTSTPRSAQRLTLPSAHFRWAPFEAEVHIDAPGDRVTLFISRRRTNAFDRNIAGTLWLADLHFEPLPEPPAEAAPDPGAAP